jgi:hypothetical protein
MMTLTTHTLELVIASLIHDYLTATQTGCADAAVPKELMDAIKEPERPVLIITTKEEPAKASERRVITINPVLCTWAKSEEAGAADVGTQTTREEASRIMAAIDHRLRDQSAFSTWLQTIDAERLEGWTIMKLVHEGHAPPIRPDASRSALFSLTMKLHLFVAPFTAA